MPKPCVGAGTDAPPTDAPDAIRWVLLENKDCFPEELPEGLSPERGVGHTIELEPGSRPVHRPMYRLSPAERVEVESTALLSKGFSEPSSSPFGAPVLFVAKKDRT